MKPTPTSIVIATALALAACQREPAPAPSSPAPSQATASADTSGLAREPWALPTTAGAAQPDLSVGPDGRLLLSFVRRIGDRNALQYAAYLGDDTWESAPKTIVIGRTLTANWAN